MRSPAHSSAQLCGCDKGANYFCSQHAMTHSQCAPTPFEVKDSGVRQAFSSGMVRDTSANKIDYTTVLNGPMFERWAIHLTKAAEKYPDVAPGRPNWMLATSEEELVRFRKSAVRHFIQWFRDDIDEDHAAAVLFNINGYEYTLQRMKQ